MQFLQLCHFPFLRSCVGDRMAFDVKPPTTVPLECVSRTGAPRNFLFCDLLSVFAFEAPALVSKLRNAMRSTDEIARYVLELLSELLAAWVEYTAIIGCSLFYRETIGEFHYYSLKKMTPSLAVFCLVLAS